MEGTRGGQPNGANNSASTKPSTMLQGPGQEPVPQVAPPAKPHPQPAPPSTTKPLPANALPYPLVTPQSVPPVNAQRAPAAGPQPVPTANPQSQPAPVPVPPSQPTLMPTAPQLKPAPQPQRQPAPAATSLSASATVPRPEAIPISQQGGGPGGESNPPSAGTTSTTRPGRDNLPTNTVPRNIPVFTKPTLATYRPAKHRGATWQDAGQYALNASILSGRFEDLRILAFSGRASPDRVCAPRALYVNSTLVTRAIPNLFQDEALKEAGEAELPLDDDALSASADFEYVDDSDLEDFEADDPVARRLDDREVKDKHAEHTAATNVAPGVSQSTLTSPAVPSRTEHNKSKHQTPGDYVEQLKPAAVRRWTSDSTEEADDFVSVPETVAAEPTPESKAKEAKTARKTPPARSAPASDVSSTPSARPTTPAKRTLVSTDTAYRTWRAVVFYAYTRRIAFAPLRSQGFPFAPVDDESDPSQLPICSSKSVYRLAIKYGHTQLEQLSGSDIASKLSAQNVLTELFSRFTARHPQIQEMQLDFAIAHIKHPNIVVGLPTWIDRFARGELAECADTFTRLIHKLACAATAPPTGVNVCPRGCAMSTIHRRCSMCGVTFN